MEESEEDSLGGESLGRLGIIQLSSHRSGEGPLSLSISKEVAREN